MYNQSSSRYCYPDSDVLINVPGLTEQKQLEAFERIVTVDRLRLLGLKPLKGQFNRSHLCNIHKFIFNDIYPFAGQLRDEDIAKDNFRFAAVRFLASQTDQLLNELRAEELLKKLSFELFIDRLTYYLTELNVLHTFREGNGRTQREFIRCLALESGYFIDWAKVDASAMLKAMIESPTNNNKLKDILYTITRKIK
ncbi:Fic/DOC family protein [Paenibacillus aquistagni]|uniref:Fic/DOC family protein n=1 Tax=Paenibacillus aquistagni TaxID=1852522 RepID=UPI00145ABB0B|nr:Fic family protein [Paenibacillus aquistagni]NMM54639.1 cell filamentation protein Fic [Paenibacillus aquistagni]